MKGSATYPKGWQDKGISLETAVVYMALDKLWLELGHRASWGSLPSVPPQSPRAPLYQKN